MKPRYSSFPKTNSSLQKCFSPHFLPTAAFCASLLTYSISGSLHAATITWDGGPATTATDLGTAENWVGDVLPNPSLADTAEWSGTVPGPLSLIYSNSAFVGIAGNTGINLSVTAGRTDPLSIDSGANISPLRMNNITLASGAGAFTLGNGADFLNLTLGGVAGQTHTWTNNSANVATVNSDTIIGLGGSGIHTIALAGSGNWLWNGAFAPKLDSLNLLKTGSGTATFNAGMTLTGNNTNATVPGSALVPIVVREGTLLLNGGTSNVTGETVIGGIVANGGVGQNAKIQMDAGSLTISDFLSVGRGNGIGATSSDLVMNNASTITVGNFSSGFNGGNVANLPKGSVTLNNTSTFTVSGNGVFRLAESTGSNMTMTLNNSSQLVASGTGTIRIGDAGTGILNIKDTATATFGNQLAYLGYRSGNGTLTMTGGTLSFTGEVRVGGSDTNNGAAENAVGTMSISGGTANFTGGFVLARGNNNVAVTAGTATLSGTAVVNSAGDVILGFAGAANLGKLTLSGATLNVGTAGAKSLMVGRWDTSKGQLDITTGSLNMMNNSSIKMNYDGTVGANVVNQSGGTVTFYSNAGTTVGGTGDLDLQRAGAAASNNTYNFNGGTLIVPKIVSTATTGTRTFNFNGGTLKPTGSNTAFMNLGAGTARANIRNLAAVINTNGFDVTIAQGLSHSDIGSDNPIDGGLSKQGVGNLTLTGISSFNGPTVVNAGTLTLSSGAINTSSGISINGSGAKLAPANFSSITPPVTLTQGSINGVATFDSLTVANSAANTLDTGSTGFLVANNLTFQGAATLNIVANGTSLERGFQSTSLTTNAAGQIIVNATNSAGFWQPGDYPIITYSTFSGLASHFVKGTIAGLDASNQQANIVNDAFNGAVVLRITGDTLTWRGNQSSSWGTGVTGNWYFPSNPSQTPNYTDSKPVLFDDSATRFTVNLTTNVAPSATVFDTSNTYTLTSSAPGFGITSGTLTKNGTGKLTITTTNTYTGATTVNNGDLEIGNGITDGSIATSSVITNNGFGSVIFNVVGNQTYPNVLAGTSGGGFTKRGAGALTLSGNSTFAGDFNLESGALNINSANALGTGPGALVITGGILNNTSGGAITSTSTKKQSWNVDFTFTGTNDLALGSGQVTLGGTGTSRTVTVSAGNFGTGQISGTGFDFVKAGAGALRVSGANITNSIVTIQSGIIGTSEDFFAGGLAGTGTLENGTANTKWSFWTIATDQTFSGIIQNGGGTGLLGIVKRGASTWTLTNNANNATANLTIDQGTLVLNNTGTYGAGNFGGGVPTNLASSIGNTAAGNAVLEINGAIVNYNCVNNADAAIFRPSLIVGNNGTGTGTVRLTSGSLTTYRQLTLGAANGSFAGFRQTGGTTTVGGFLALGLGTATGVFNQSGGTFTMPTTPVTNAAGTGSTGLMNLSGTAVFNLNGTVDNGLWIGEAGSGFLNVSGSAAINFAATNNGLQLGRVAAGTGVVNLLGGNVTTPKVYKGLGAGTLNFNGGTLTANAAGTTFLTGLTNTYVRSGGGTINNGGNAITIGQSLLAPSGNGVSATGLTVSGGGFIATPIVVITGDGTGATAVANIDSSGNLTGITMTNPGNGYSNAPTFTLIGGGIGNTGAIGGTATLVATTGGGMTFSGAAVTTLSGANTYTGNTTVASGTTVVLADNATLQFAPKANGVSNKLTGGGTATLAGDFNINLTSAAVANGNSWTLVDATSVSYDSVLFTVTGFNKVGSNWTKTDGNNTWTFNQLDGTLKLAVSGASGYASDWANLYAPGQLADADHDNDGVKNGVEYFMGQTGSTFTANPGIVTVGANRTVTWPKRTATAFNGTYRVEISSNLATWTQAAANDVVDNGSSVVYTLPTGSTKLFVRLVVVPN